MTRLTNGLAQRFAGVVGMAAIASLVALPGLSQTTRPNDTRIPSTEDRTADDDSMTPRGEPGTPDMEDGMTPRQGEMRTPATQNQGSPGDRTSTVSQLDREFLRLAYQGNNAEIQTSRLALERSQNDDIREYAQRMITEHTRANEQLTRYATQQNIQLPSERVDPLSQAIAARLGQLSGDAFDQAYIDAQANAHLRAIALYRTQISQGQTQGLRTYASQLLPSIEQHYEMASEMLPNYASDNLRPGVDVQPVQ
jgi:putative membrane protein